MEQLLGELTSQIKSPFFNKHYFEYSQLIINDPSSFVPKNVTPNCTILDLILVYFKGIDNFFDDLEEAIVAECNNQQLKNVEEISTIVRSKITEINDQNILIELFGLKSVKECETEANI